MGVVEELVRGREAFERREWAVAYDRLATLDPAELTAEDLAALGAAAFLLGDREAAVQALQRAFQRHVDQGATVAAARDAFWIALFFIESGERAVGGGWVARARRLLDAGPGDPVAHGYLLIHEMFRHIGAEEYAQALPIAVQITEIGEAHDNADLTAMGLSARGRLMLYMDRVAEGLGLLDEAMVRVATAEVSPILAGGLYCAMVEGCQQVSDFQRMTAWTRALTQWCQSQPDLVPFTGQSAVHRAQIMRSEGAFPQALEELAFAVERYHLRGFDPAEGLAFYERGEVLRLLGDQPGAESAYAQASALGCEPQPGLALLWLSRGRTAAAVSTAQRLLWETVGDVPRSRVLPAAVEILLGAQERESARSAAEELAAIASRFGCQAVGAMAAYALGCVHLEEGDADGALPHLRRAWKSWIDLGARYEAARARTQIGLAFRLHGDEDSARAELAVALRTLRELGAAPAAEQVERLLHRPFPDGLTAREVEVLRLVASGRSNPQIAGELFLSEKTVARHLSNIFTKISVASRTAAAAYAYEHDLL